MTADPDRGTRTGSPVPQRDAARPRPGRRRTFLRSLVALSVGLGASPARSEPAGRLLFGYTLTPGLEGMVAAVLRRLQQIYSPSLGTRSIFVPGTATADVTDVVENAEPDGGTVLMSSSSAMTLGSMMAARKATRDALLPVVGIGQLTYAFIVGPAVPADIKSLAAFLLWAGVNPGFAQYGVPGRGTAGHFVGTEVVRLSGVPLKSVGYQSMVPLMKDVASGSMAAGVALVLGPEDTARYPTIRMLAVGSQARWPGSDDVPTLLELGFAETPVSTSLGFFVSSRTPPEKVADLKKAVAIAVQDAAVYAALRAAGLLPLSAPDDYAALVAEERAAWKDRIDRRGFTALS